MEAEVLLCSQDITAEIQCSCWLVATFASCRGGNFFPFHNVVFLQMYPENIKQLSTKFDRERVSLAIAGKKTTNPMGKGWHVPHLVELRASVQSRKGERDCMECHWYCCSRNGVFFSTSHVCWGRLPPSHRMYNIQSICQKKSQGFFSRPFLLL